MEKLLLKAYQRFVLAHITLFLIASAVYIIQNIKNLSVIAGVVTSFDFGLFLVITKILVIQGKTNLMI